MVKVKLNVILNTLTVLRRKIWTGMLESASQENLKLAKCNQTEILVSLLSLIVLMM